MKKILLVIAALFISMLSFADTTATPAAAPAPSMLAQLPAFLDKLDTVRGKALTVAEKGAVTGVVTKGNTSVDSIQSKFLGTTSKVTGLDTTTLGLMFPSATQPVSNSDLSSKVEDKMGSKLNYFQKTSLKAANTLRNNSLDGLKTTMTNGVSKKLGMDPTVVSGLLPLLGL